MNTLVDAFDAIAQGEVLAKLLETAAAELEKHPAHAEERAWLVTAAGRVGAAHAPVGDLLTRALRLPELEALRAERSRTLQGNVVDAFEALQVAIATKIGERSPLIEAIFRNIKTPQLRKVAKKDFEKQMAEIEKRLASSYVSRMLGDPDYAVLQPALASYRDALGIWENIFSGDPPSEEEQADLREELDKRAYAIENASRQARLLVEAAQVTAFDFFDATKIFEKPKRRGGRRTEVAEERKAPEEAVGSTGDLFADTR